MMGIFSTTDPTLIRMIAENERKRTMMKMHQSPAYKACWACGLDKLSGNIHRLRMETGTRHGIIEAEICVDCLNNILDAHIKESELDDDEPAPPRICTDLGIDWERADRAYDERI